MMGEADKLPEWIDRVAPATPINAVVVEMGEDGRFTIWVQLKSDDKAIADRLQELAHLIMHSGVARLVKP